MNRRTLLYWPIVIGYELIFRARRLVGHYSAAERFDIEKTNEEYRHLEEKQWKYYRKLIRKYPEMTWTRKYLKSGRALVVPGVLAFWTLELRNLHTLWTDNASLEQAIAFLDHGFRFASAVFLQSGNPHSIAVWGHDSRRREFYFYDSLGNYNSGYRLNYNRLCYISYGDFIRKNIGKDVSITVVMPANERLELAKSLLEGTGYYLV